MQILNKRKDTIPPGARYVGRPSIYGNPFQIGKDGSREEVIAKFERYFYDRLSRDQAFRNAVEALKDASALVCWCAPERCHAEIIARHLLSYSQ